MNALRIFCSLIIVLFFSGSVFGDERPMLHYTVEDGLPSNTVYKSYRTKDGSLWFCTDKGITRFNGLTFETFTTLDGLSDNEIFDINEDYSGRLWLSTYNGAICYYKNGMFHSAANTKFLKLPFKASMITWTNIETDSSITFNFYNQSAFVNIKNNQSYIYYLARLNRVFLGEKILSISKKNANSFEFLYSDKQVFADTNMNIKSCRKFDKNRIYNIATRNEIYAIKEGIYNSTGKQIRHLMPEFWKKRILNRVYIDQENLFLCTSSGLYINDDLILLEKTAISQVIKDGDGNYVICTLNNGFFVLSKTFKTNMCVKNAYDGIAKYAKVQQEDLYIGSHNKSLYRLRNGLSTCLFNSTPFINPNTTSPTFKNAYLIADNNYFAFGQGENFIVKNIDKRPILKRLAIKKTEVIVGMLRSEAQIYIVGNEWISCIDYASLLNFKSPVFKYAFNQNNLLNNRIFSSATSDNGQLWYSDRSGIYKLIDNKPIIQKQFKDLSFRTFIICGNYLVGYTHSNDLLICKDFEGNISIELVKGERCVWDKLYKLDNRHIIVSTNNLYRVITFPPENKNLNYTIRTIDNPFIPLRAEYICSNGSICFFLKEGSVTGFQTKEILDKELPPTISFSSINTKQKEIEVNKLLHLSYKDAKDITLRFTTSSFSKNIYSEYTISHNDEHEVWHRAEGRSIILYNLGYGSYKIKLRARFASSLFSSPVMIELLVAKPWWATWWFVLCSCITLIAATGFVIKYRFKSILNKKEQIHHAEIKFLRSEYKALNALMNPHFIFNAMNSVQSLINTDNRKSASEYLRTFSDLLRQNLHNISNEFITLEQELELIKNYLKIEKLRFDDVLNYEIDIAGSIELDDILIPPLLIQPLVENAVKHGLFHKQSKDNHISINIYTHAQLLYIEVVDNGIGLNSIKDKDNIRHESYGIENIKKRIYQLGLMHKQQIDFEITEVKNMDNVVTGTKAVVVIEIIEYQEQ